MYRQENTGFARAKKADGFSFQRKENGCFLERDNEEEYTLGKQGIQKKCV